MNRYLRLIYLSILFEKNRRDVYHNAATALSQLSYKRVTKETTKKIKNKTSINGVDDYMSCLPARAETAVPFSGV